MIAIEGIRFSYSWGSFIDYLRNVKMILHNTSVKIMDMLKKSSSAMKARMFTIEWNDLNNINEVVMS